MKNDCVGYDTVTSSHRLQSLSGALESKSQHSFSGKMMKIVALVLIASAFLFEIADAVDDQQKVRCQKTVQDTMDRMVKQMSSLPFKVCKKNIALKRRL